MPRVYLSKIELSLLENMLIYNNAQLRKAKSRAKQLLLPINEKLLTKVREAKLVSFSERDD